eukprot:IDg3319t1
MSASTAYCLAPPEMLKQIAKSIDVDYGVLEVIQGDPFRPNLTLSVRSLKDESMATSNRNTAVDIKIAWCRIRKKFKQGRGSNSGKCLVAFLTIAEVGTFMEDIQYSVNAAE